MTLDNVNMIDESAIETAVSFDYLPNEYKKYVENIRSNEANAFDYIIKNTQNSIEYIQENVPGVFGDYPTLINHTNALLMMTFFKGMVIGESRWKPKLDFMLTGQYNVQGKDFE